MSDKEVIVVGYVKSGNTWLARLLGDILDSPVVGFKKATPIATEGKDRNGEYTVRQLHLRFTNDCSGDGFLQTGWLACENNWNGEKVVHITRDPRDIAVSAMNYWNIDSIDKTIECMINGLHPLAGVGKWNDFIWQWINCKSFPVYRTSYELLSTNTLKEMINILWFFRINISAPRISQAINRQSFSNKVKEINNDGDTRPYGKAIQLKNLRKGIVGDWKKHLSKEQNDKIIDNFGHIMFMLGYDIGSVK